MSAANYTYSWQLPGPFFNHSYPYIPVGTSAFPADIGWSMNTSGISDVGRRRLSMNHKKILGVGWEYQSHKPSLSIMCRIYIEWLHPKAQGKDPDNMEMLVGWSFPGKRAVVDTERRGR